MKILGNAPIYQKGKITIPKKVRKHLKIEAGDSVIFELRTLNNYESIVILSKNELEEEKKRFITYAANKD